jgi:acyl-CoA reductase-like NAD-dependent aldehyde dehydrogenase
MTPAYAPDYGEMVEQARTAPLTAPQRERALDEIAERRSELERELEQLRAFETGHTHALISERTYAAMIEDVVALMDKWGYTPKCARCEQPDWLEDALNGRR